MNAELAARRRGFWERVAVSVDARWMRYSWRLPGPANALELRVVALRRSGHHAIVNWLRRQAPGRHCFLNDCRPGENPFASTANRFSARAGLGQIEHMRIFWDQEIAGRHAKKGTLLYNYEDCDLSAVATEDFESCRERWVGVSNRRNDVLILRDPFNLLASKLRWARGSSYTPDPATLPDIVRLWKAYANEFLGRTRVLSDVVPISYNAWFTSREERESIARRLGLRVGDDGLQDVARWGPVMWGDSFDGLEFEGRAQEMKVLSRWRNFVDDAEYRELLRDDELWELSREIFGELPGTEALS